MKIKSSCFFIMLAMSYSTFVHSDPQIIQVDSARIDVVQGKEIFGNEKMQSIVRIRYTLKKDVELVSVELKEFGTGTQLETIGWFVSDTDLGFDHNIGRSVREHTNDQKLVEIKENYIKKYISSSKNNENIAVCFEIKTKTKTKTNNVEQVYSSCFDDYLINGFVELFSLRPVEFVSGDFYYKYEYEIRRFPRAGRPELLAKLWTLQKTQKIPSHYIFKVENTFNDYSTEATALIPTGNNKDSHIINKTPYDFNSTHSAFTYKLLSDKSSFVKFPVFFSQDLLLNEIFPISNQSSILNVLNVKYSNYEMLMESNICKENGSELLYSCLDSVTRVGKQVSADTIRKYLQLPVIEVIHLIDNYGSSHKVYQLYTDKYDPST